MFYTVADFLCCRNEDKMKIQGVNCRPNFLGARVNIVANSDNHGNLNNLPDLYNAIKQNREDIFQKADEKSTLNLYINVGDFFMNPSKKGFISFPDKTNGEVQKEFLEKFIDKIRKTANTSCYEINELAKKKGLVCPNLQTNFDALYTPGNHCFDGGDEMFYNLANNTKGMTVVMTNVNQAYSPLFKQVSVGSKKFVTSKVYEIQDDKDPNKKHHLMVIGATIPAMDFYNPGLVVGTEFSDSNAKKDSKMTAEDIKNTVKSIDKKVKKFKKDHPKGIVILSSHMGTKLSKIVRDEVDGIKEILDGHKHDIATTVKKDCVISSLGMDNNILKSIALILNDDGEIEERESRVYCSEEYRLEKSNRKENSLQRLLTQTYADDYDPLVKITDNSGTESEVSLAYKPSIRYANSHLANFLTSAIKTSLQKVKDEKDVIAVGIQSSIIRGGIENGSNNMAILKVFDGVSEDLSDIKTGYVSGRRLAAVILENIKDNLEAPTRNTIIHWSDIKIDKDGIAHLLKGNKDATAEDVLKFIRIRTMDDMPYEPIDPDECYKIALADKYLKKEDIEMPKKIRGNFKSTGETYNTLFLDYLKSCAYNIKMEPKFKEERIKFDD